jgi:Concanavalin A-like lectin/glucanases superfamily
LSFAISGGDEMSNEYRDAVLSKGPVGYWRVGDAQGLTAVDQTGHNHGGTYHAAPVTPTAGAIAGDPDGAFSVYRPFYVEIAGGVVFSQPTSGQGLTVEAWLRPDSLDFQGETAENYVHWLGKGEAGRLEWGFRFYPLSSSRPNRISAYIWNPAGGEGAGAYFEDTLTAGEWVHVVACYDPGDHKNPTAGVHVYKNGVHRLGPPSPGTLYSNPLFQTSPRHGTAPVRLGTRDLGSFLQGAIDEVAIYPRVLSAAEIQDNYDTGVS